MLEIFWLVTLMETSSTLLSSPMMELCWENSNVLMWRWIFWSIFQPKYICVFQVSRCCGLKITSEGYVVTLAKNNHHVLVLNTLYINWMVCKKNVVDCKLWLSRTSFKFSVSSEWNFSSVETSERWFFWSYLSYSKILFIYKILYYTIPPIGGLLFYDLYILGIWKSFLMDVCRKDFLLILFACSQSFKYFNFTLLYKKETNYIFYVCNCLSIDYVCQNQKTIFKNVFVVNFICRTSSEWMQKIFMELIYSPF